MHSNEPYMRQSIPGTTGNVGGRSRTITFVQKVDNPLSPVKQGRGTWEQRVAWLPSGVLVVEFFSTMKDVPFSDAWGIRKKWVFRPSGNVGLDSSACQLTASLECVFFKKLMWAGKIESETISTATRDYVRLQAKVIEYLQGEGAVATPLAIAPQPSTLSKMSTGELEVDMLRKRLTECEAFLRTGAAVRVNGGVPSWLLGNGKKSKEAGDFVLRAVQDPVSGAWTWAVEMTGTTGEATTATPDNKKADSVGKQPRVTAWPANATVAPPA